MTDPGGSLSAEASAVLSLVQQAAKQLASDPTAALTLEQIEAMHALTHLVARPALLVVEGKPQAIPDSWPRLVEDEERIRARLSGVGRIDTAGRLPCGTAWLIHEQKLLTNNHVVGALCGLDVLAEDSNWRAELPDAVARANDAWARDETQRPFWDPGDTPPGSSPARVSRVIATHSKLDMAMLELVGLKNRAARVLEIGQSPPAKLDGEMIYVPGYPVVAKGKGLPSVLVDVLFGGPSVRFNKRIAPGCLRGSDGSFVFHDASTLGGNSGSPLVSFESHEVVGLHFHGTYATRNDAVALWTLLDDPFFGLS